MKILCALVLGFAMLGLAVPAARAEVGIDVTVFNHTSYPLKLATAGDHSCWYPYDLRLDKSPTVPPGDYSNLYTAAKETIGCIFGTADRFQELGVYLQQPGGRLQDAIAVSTRPSPQSPSLPASNVGKWRVRVTGIPVFQGTPRRWLPLNALQQGANTPGGGGMFCVSWNVSVVPSPHWHREVHIYEGNDCRRDTALAAGSVRNKAPRRAAPSPAGPASGAGTRRDDATRIVYDLFQLGRAACNLLNPDRPWFEADCDRIADGSQWDLDNVSATVDSVEPDNDPIVTYGYTKLASPSANNTTDSQGALTYSYTESLGETRQTATQSGWALGEKVAWKADFKIPVIGGDLSAEISSTQNWSSTQTTQTSRQISQTVGASHPTKPHGTTWLVVFQPTATLDFNFSGELTLGKPGEVGTDAEADPPRAQPLVTPLARSLGMSPAVVHPCAGYLIGDGDPNSLMGLGAAAAQQGYSDKTPGLPQDQKDFLSAVPGFSVSKGDRCPGWPDGYPAGAAFKGRASLHAVAGPPDPNNPPPPNNWASPERLRGIVVCEYYKPFGGQPQAAATSSSGEGPCSPAPPSGSPQGSSAPGSVIDGAADPTTTRLEGDHTSNLIVGDEHPDVDVMTAQGGAFDVLLGNTHPEVLDGGDGTDFLSGGGGADRLHGGAGDDTLEGGAGNDRLVDLEGHNRVVGGPGDDQLVSGSGASGGLFGGRGDDTLTMKGRAAVALSGGPGDDHYRLSAEAVSRRVVEFPGGGIDTIHTAASTKLPPNVERLVASSSAGLELRSGQGGQELIGGPGDDRLDGGPGNDVLNGRRGDDELLLSRYGFDHARGGPGADRFVALAHLARMAPSRGFEPKGRPSAHLIEDLHVDKGDRIVLSTERLGRPLARLRGRVRITYARRPRGRAPQFLFTRRDHLLRFDPDGRGARPAQMIAIVRNHRRLPARAIEIVRGDRDGRR